MNEHTKEPWTGDCFTVPMDGVRINDSDGHCVAKVVIVHQVQGQNWDEAVNQCAARARRIVACVNACAGISIDTLETVAATPNQALAVLTMGESKR